jgi:inner membrane protein
MKDTFSRILSSTSFKFIVIGILSILLLIPVAMIRDLIRERQDRSNEAIMEVSQKWGLAQTITGPYLTIPVRETLIKDNKVEYIQKQLNLLPEHLEITGEVNPAEKKRGIFRVVVYESFMEISGHFHTSAEILESVGDPEIVDRLFFMNLGLTDLRGIREVVITINGEPAEELPGLPYRHVIEQGIHIPIPSGILSYDKISFEIQLRLDGSSDLNFTPMGKTTRITLSSTWADPSFTGSFLPESREITDQGFSARWSVNYLNRNFPQHWYNSGPDVVPSQFGVHFLIPVDHYQKSMRSIKYAFMFIALSFLIFFLTELISGTRMHPIQYLLVGIALVVFYTLLISLAEHTGFNMAYLISSLATTILIGLYVRASTGKWKQGLLTWALLSGLYGFLFTTLQLQDYSLLFGSIGIFLVVAIVMFVSRKVNWYREGAQSSDSSGQ